MLAPGLLTAFGMSFAFIPATICATAGVPRHEAGLASAVLNTARLFGGALGLAILAAIATSHTDAALQHPSAVAHTYARRSSAASRSRSWSPRGSRSSGR